MYRYIDTSKQRENLSGGDGPCKISGGKMGKKNVFLWKEVKVAKVEDKEIIVVVPFETREEAKKVGKMLLENYLAFVVRVVGDVYQAWVEKDGKMGEGEVAVLRIRTMKNKVGEIYKKIKEIHPWPTFCFEVLEFEEGVC